MDKHYKNHGNKKKGRNNDPDCFGEKRKISQKEIDNTSREVGTTGCPKGNAGGFYEILTHTQRMEDIMKEITFNGKENIEEELEIEKEQCRRKMNKNNVVRQTQYASKTSTRQMDNCDSCHNVYSEKLYLLKLERF